MITTSFKITGHVSSEVLKNRCTVNSIWCTTVGLREFLQNFRERQRRSIILHQYNVRDHTTASNLSSILMLKTNILGHSLYSPELATNVILLLQVKDK